MIKWDRLINKCNNYGNKRRDHIKKGRQILKLSTVSCAVPLVFPQAVTRSDLFCCFHGNGSFSSSQYWILFWSESVSNSWYLSFILVKNLASLSYRLQCSRKWRSLSVLSHYLPSSFCPYSLFLSSVSASSFSLPALSLSLSLQFSSVCFIGMNVRWTVLPKHPHLSFFSLPVSLSR